mgnify:CR=1 FL=1
MVTIPFFRNLTLQIKTFLGYYDKKTKKNNQQTSKETMFLGTDWQTAHFLHKRDNEKASQ